MILASDLDRTLIHPTRSLDPALAGATRTIEVYDGRPGGPGSAMSERAIELLDELGARHTYVPVTTRSRSQVERLDRVVLDPAARFTICANGGLVLDRGVPDPDWSERVRADLEGAGVGLADADAALTAALLETGSDTWLLRARDCEGLFWYGICDLDAMPDGAVDHATDRLGPLGWTVNRQGRKLYALPEALTKVRALDHVRERLGADGPLVCAGDAELDRCLLEVADMGLCPAGSESAAAPDRLPAHVRITPREHVLAAEDILEAALGLAAGSAPAAAPASG